MYAVRHGAKQYKKGQSASCPRVSVRLIPSLCQLAQRPCLQRGQVHIYSKGTEFYNNITKSHSCRSSCKMKQLSTTRHYPGSKLPRTAMHCCTLLYTVRQGALRLAPAFDSLFTHYIFITLLCYI